MKVRGGVLITLLALTAFCSIVHLAYDLYITAYVTKMENDQRSGYGPFWQATISGRPEDTHQRRLSPAEVGQRFKQRLQRLNHACLKYGHSPFFRHLSLTGIMQNVGAYWPVMNVSVKYCPIEKTGSTTWRRYFDSVSEHMRRIGVQKSSPRPGVKEISFLFVREPYQRLLSAYVDKFFSPNSLYWGYFGQYIVKNFRLNPSNHSLTCGHDVTFPEFVRYVIHSQETGQYRDRHFVPAHDHCGVCSKWNVTYDYIGHLETLNEDMAYLLTEMQSPVNYSVNFDRATLDNNARWVLNRMAPQIRKCISMKEACLRLWKKWHIRGILSKTEPLPVTGEEAEVIRAKGFINLSLQALARSGPKWKRRRQKAEALREAFASIPLQDRLRLRSLLLLDFELFGFDPTPESVFPFRRSGFSDRGGYRYFDLNSEYLKQ